MTNWAEITSVVEPPAGIGAIIWLIIRGKLRPQKQIDEIIQSDNERVKVYADLAKTWREAYEREAAARATQEAALRECLEMSRASLKILEALRKAAKIE